MNRRDDLPELVSESQGLRMLDLPATPHWRNFLRRQLPSTSTGAGNLYDRFAVQELAARISDFAAATNPPEVSSTSTRATAGDLIDRRGPACR